MSGFFAVYAPTQLGQVRQNFEITGQTPEEVMAAAQACAPQAPADYYLFAIRARYGNTEGPFVWVTGEAGGWDEEAFIAHLNPFAADED